MSTDAKKRAVKKYQEKFDTVVIRVPKGRGIHYEICPARRLRDNGA